MAGLEHQGEQIEALTLGTAFKGVLNSVIRTNNILEQYFEKNRHSCKKFTRSKLSKFKIDTASVYRFFFGLSCSMAVY